MTMPSSLKLKKAPEQNQTSQSFSQSSFPSTLKPKKQIQNNQEFPSEEEEEKEYERHQSRFLSRVLEGTLGVPGDIASFGAGLFGKEQNVLPTSQKLKEFSQEASQGYTKPKNEFEENIDELASDIGSMAFPGGGHYKLARNIGIPIVSNLVKEGLKYSNADEKNQAYGKVGAMVALDLISRRSGGVKSHLNSLYDKAEKSLPNGVSIKATELERSLNKLENTLTAGGSRPTTKKSLEKIIEIKNEIKNGKVDVKRLVAYRPSINEAITELGGFNAEVPMKLAPKAIKNLNDVKSEVIKTLNQYGEKFNPEFLKNWHDANEGYAAYAKSNVIANFLHNKIPYAPKSKAVQSLFSYAPTAAIVAATKLSPVGAAGAAAGYSAYQGFKVLHRIKNSPTLSKYYSGILKEAALGNVPEATKNLKALDENLKE